MSRLRILVCVGLMGLSVFGNAGMAVAADKPDRVAGFKRMVERLREAGNKQVKYTEFPDADHATANAAVSGSCVDVDRSVSLTLQDESTSP